MTLSARKKIKPIVGVINVVSEFVTKTLPWIAVAVGNLNPKTDDNPWRLNFKGLKEAIAAKIDTKVLDSLNKYKEQIKKNRDSYSLPEYQQVVAIIEFEEKKWRNMQENILALSPDKVTWYKEYLERWHNRDIERMNEVKAGLIVEMKKIMEAD